MRRALAGLVIAFAIGAQPGATSDGPAAPPALVKHARKHWPHRWRESLSVARCESRFYRFARNGQYLGFWQMGERERRVTGWTWWSQARAAARYFRLTGYDWSPWACKP